MNLKPQLKLVGIIILLFIGTAVVTSSLPNKPPDTANNALTPSPTPNTQLTPIQETVPSSPNPTYQKVKFVIDGDTFELQNGQRVRLIGVDTPETSPNECYSREATQRTKQLIENQTVGLEKDVSETDRYGRLLRYVYVGDVFLNDVLVREGYANALTYPPDVKFHGQFRQAEAEARENQRGLWGEVCQTPSPSTLGATTVPTQFTPGNCQYSCSGPDRDCSNFSTHTEAQAFFDCCGFTASYDPMKLDRASGEGNGIACESLP